MATYTSDEQRARQSIKEELQAISDYEDRQLASSSVPLKNVFAHLIKEEKQHAALLIDWLTKHDKQQGEFLITQSKVD